MGMIGAGDLDRRVIVLRHQGTPDGYGGVSGDWIEHGEPVPAARRDVSDGERMQAGRLTGELLTRFTVRSSSFTRSITRADRLECDGIEWEIVGIKELGRRQWLEITAEARF